MRRLWLLSLLLLPQLVRAQGDAGSPLDEAGQLMREGLDRDLPPPSTRPVRWPTAEGPHPHALPPGAAKVDALTERVRHEASIRARALAEERRIAPDDQPGVGQSRTRAAKAVGPPSRPRPPRP